MANTLVSAHIHFILLSFAWNLWKISLLKPGGNYSPCCSNSVPHLFVLCFREKIYPLATLPLLELIILIVPVIVRESS